MRRPVDIDALLQSSPSDSLPLLLELARLQAARRRPRDLLTQLERDGFVHASPLDQRLCNRLDALALEAASDFEAVQLSPVAPLGVCSVLAPTSQDRTLSAQRGTEVVSDPTNVMALMCARRLAATPTQPVRLCTVHQTLRAQALPDKPGFTRHFRLFALVEAGAAQPDDGFEVATIARHIGVFDRVFDLAGPALGCAVRRRFVRVLSTAPRRVLAERAAIALAAALPHLAIERGDLAQPYYDGLRIMYFAEPPAGDPAPIGDLGLFDWMGKLTANHRLRMVASGMGIQLLPLLYRPA